MILVKTSSFWVGNSNYSKSLYLLDINCIICCVWPQDVKRRILYVAEWRARGVWRSTIRPEKTRGWGNFIWIVWWNHRLNFYVLGKWERINKANRRRIRSYISASTFESTSSDIWIHTQSFFASFDSHISGWMGWSFPISNYYFSCKRSMSSRCFFFAKLWIDLIKFIFLQDIFGVMLGGVLGHSLCTGLAVLGGRMIAQKISVKTGN